MSEVKKDIQTTAEGKNETSSYRSIFKATSLFGGVQVYQILISVIKQKFVAVLLGTAGVGIQGLLQSGIQLIQVFTSMGLSQSAVRDVSEANGSNDYDRISRTVTVLRRLVWITGLLGLIATVAFSPLLSKSLFGNYDYTLSFIILSVILLIDQISNGQRVLLQGMRQIRYLARASALGATIGLIVSVPLYYLLGVKGIVPTLIINSFTTLILSWLFARKIKVNKVEISTKEVLVEGRTMLKMGVSMSISMILVMSFSYMLRGFIRNYGGIEQVGLFTAGFAIVNTYVGMVFSAMSTDFYPRLAGVNRDNNKCRDLMNQQLEVASFIMGPLLTICLIFMPLIIRLLYSDAFLMANDYIFWASVGLLFKLASWVIAFQIIAKGDARLYIFTELIGNVTSFVLSMVGYRYGGLTGLGIAFLMGYLLYFFLVFIITHRKYYYNFSESSLKIWLLQVCFVCLCIIIVYFACSWMRYVLGSMVIVISCVLSFKGLNSRIQLLSLIKRKYGNTK